MTAALLFDLDGTLIDTDRIHLAAFQSVFAPLGITVDWDTYRTRIMGRNNVEIAANFLTAQPSGDHAGIMDAKEAAYRERLTALEPAPGLMALLDWADANAVACAVVTNAPRANADLVLDTLALRSRFRVLVIGPELAEAKPHPLPYLTAIATLGADPSRSLAFEDSPSGLRSALGAGLPVIGLTTSLDAPTLLAAGVVHAAADFTDPELLRMVAQRCEA